MRLELCRPCSHSLLPDGFVPVFMRPTAAPTGMDGGFCRFLRSFSGGWLECRTIRSTGEIRPSCFLSVCGKEVASGGRENRLLPGMSAAARRSLRRQEAADAFFEGPRSFERVRRALTQKRLLLSGRIDGEDLGVVLIQLAELNLMHDPILYE